MGTILAPSILSADFSCLADDVKRLEKSGIKNIHLDIMDGHFVDNITFGVGTVKCLRPHTNTVFDAHLMVTKPDKLLAGLADAGVNDITVHKEACVHLYHTLESIKKLGMHPGVVLNPATDYTSLRYVAQDGLLEKVLIMSVEPGFGGQSYLPMSTKKIADLAKWREENNFIFNIEVDGGINIDNIKSVVTAGANEIVIGSAMFKNRHLEENVKAFREKLGI